MSIRESIVVKFKNSDNEKLKPLAYKYSWNIEKAVTDNISSVMVFDSKIRSVELIDSLNSLLDEYSQLYNIKLNGYLHNVGTWTFPHKEYDSIVANIIDGKIILIKK
jgi:hypothetical protein